MEREPQPVPIVAMDSSITDLLKPGEDPRDVREGLIRQLQERFPELIEEHTVAALRGEHSMIITGVAPEYRDAAPVIGRIYGLLHWEMRQHPERFPPR
jgi:hypothetical protein